MIGFWIAAALLSAAAAALVLLRAAAAARAPLGDPTLEVYRRQLGEIDDLAERGLLPEDERRSAHAEAARRLLGAARAAGPAMGAAPSRRVRAAVLLAAVAAPLVALGLYLLLGSPGLPDQPFARRLAAWRSGDLRSLTPAQMTAVLQSVVQERPSGPRPRLYLARAQAAAGDLPGAIDTLHAAARLAPTDADIWADMGELQVVEDQGVESTTSDADFRKALALDPRSPSARYHLARSLIASGQVEQGLAQWRALAADLPPNDPASPALLQEIAATAKAGRLVAAPAEDQAQAAQGQAAPADQRAFIQSMVDSLAAKLKVQPDDPAGWARLIRAYGVLGETDRQKAARAEAGRLFKDKPDVLKSIDQALAGPPQ